MNSIGKILQLTTFGESHGPALGGILDGFPPSVVIDQEFIQSELDRRRPGQSAVTTGRKEPDKVEFLSGIFEGQSTGAPIAFIVRNSDQHSSDYNNLKDLFRPSHADYTYLAKYGIRDHKGGGRASARTTVAHCVAGALAKLALKQAISGLDIYAFTSQIGDISISTENEAAYSRTVSESNAVRCPDAEKAALMEALVRQMKQERDSVGGIVTCIVNGCPAGLGQPMFDKLHASLGAAMLNINAVKGFEYGDGFAVASQRGSYHNDTFISENGKVMTRTNHSGGIQGGISNGMPIRFRVVFKPTPTIGLEQQTLTTGGEAISYEATGRHDPCVVPRAVPVVEAMTALVLLDHYLTDKASRL